MDQYKMMQISKVMTSSAAQLDAALARALEFVTESYKADLCLNPNCTLRTVRSAGPENIRIMQINKLVLDEKDVHTRLVSLFNTMHDMAEACFLIIRGHAMDRTDLYLGVRAKENLVSAFDAMMGNLTANFNGTAVRALTGENIRSILNRLQGNPGAPQSAAMVSMIPSRRNMVDSSADSLDMQGLDVFIDTLRGKEYTAVLLASPVDKAGVTLRRHALESLAASISPLEKITYQYGKNNSVSKQYSINKSIANGINASVSDAYSSSTTHSAGKSRGHASNMNLHFKTMGIGGGGGSQNGTFFSDGTTQGNTHTDTQGTSNVETLAQGLSDGWTEGMAENWSTTFTNHSVSSILKEVEKQIGRIEQCDAYGAWDACAYFVSPDPSTARTAANNFKSLVCGENSAGSVNVWVPGARNLSSMLNNIAALELPVFEMNGHACQAATMISGSEMPILMNLPRKSVRGLPVTRMAAFGREAFSLRPDDPSVNRSLEIGNGEVPLGNVYHMGVEDRNNMIALNVNMFSSHVLFTGTTGVGKSTTVAMLTNALARENVRFTLIEPVKGEYKHLLGKLPGVQVFTSDPYLCRLLRINPFEFRKGIQVLAHIDRLIDIFSVCWPLYAAQPAILRETIEEAYIACGWDLSNSKYMRKGMPQYPTFSTLLEILPQVIKRSKFVGESKGTYEGALLARLGMLTRGLYGQMLNGAGGVTDEELFDGRVIIDLSAAGSQETIALIMGLLIIRLREYRTVTGFADNSPLKHVMILEEAHNIFPREQPGSVEGENVTGKAVEMLVQCIAEMRTYGQGFFIADQSPSAINIAGLRNTATKVVMQLPEEDDQSAIAKSLSLNEEQTRELSRLPRRVAVVYQNSWLEPVLVKVCNSKETSLEQAYKPWQDITTEEEIGEARGQLMHRLIPMMESGMLVPEMLVNDGMLAFRTRLNTCKQRDLVAICRHYIDWYKTIGPLDDEEDDERRIEFFHKFITDLLACELFLRLSDMPTQEAMKNSATAKSLRYSWTVRARELIDAYATGLNNAEKDSLLKLFLSAGGERCKHLL